MIREFGTFQSLITCDAGDRSPYPIETSLNGFKFSRSSNSENQTTLTTIKFKVHIYVPFFSFLSNQPADDKLGIRFFIGEGKSTFCSSIEAKGNSQSPKS